MAKKRGPFYLVAEHAPKMAIITATLYMIVTFFNTVFNNVLGSIQEPVTQIMLFGAYLSLPLIVFDIVFTEYDPKKDADIVMAGFVNYFALLIAYTKIEWAAVKPVVQWVMYAYLAMFIISMIYILIGYMKVRMGIKG